MKKLAVTRGVDVVGLEDAARRQYKNHSFVEQVEVEDDACLLSVLEEEPDGDCYRGSLVTLFAAETESPSSYYPTGNPFRLHERFAILVRAERNLLKNVQMRGSSTLDELSRAVGCGPTLETRSQLEWGLPKGLVPPQRWVEASWRVVKDRIMQLVRPNERIDLDPAIRSEKTRKGRFIYLNAGEGLTGWVKIGKANTCHVDRLRKQQLCNPRPLGHLGVWEIPQEAQLHAEETHAKKLLSAAGASRGTGGSEWRRIDWRKAVDILAVGAPNRGWKAVERI